MVFGSLVTGIKALGAGVGGFLVGSLVWSVVSGILAGLLDSVGVVTPPSLWLMATPAVGGLVALLVTGKVVGSGT